jgi:hypothetical protein
MTKDNTPIEPIAYFLLEFCQKFAISKSSFYREVRTGRLRIYKRGKRTMIEKSEAERWYACMTSGSTHNFAAQLSGPPHIDLPMA